MYLIGTSPDTGFGHIPLNAPNTVKMDTVKESIEMNEKNPVRFEKLMAMQFIRKRKQLSACDVK